MVRLLTKPTLAKLYKHCPTHGPLPRSEFYRNKARPDGLQSSCKVCHSTKVTAHQRANRSSILSARRARYWADPDTARENARNWARENRPAARASELRYRRAKPWKHRAKCGARRARMCNVMGAKALNAHYFPHMTSGCFTGNIEDTYALADTMSRIFGTPYEVDHHIPLVRRGPHVNENLNVLSLSENRRKHDRISE